MVGALSCVALLDLVPGFVMAGLFLAAGGAMLWLGRGAGRQPAAEAPAPPAVELLGSFPEALCLIDAEGEIRWTNTACAQLLGRPAEALRGLPLTALTDEASRERISALVEADAAVAAEVLVPVGESPPRHLRARRLAWPDPPDGAPGDQVLLLTDVTEQRALHRQVEGIRRILDHLPTAVCAVDATSPDLPLTYVNHEFTRMTGYGASDAIGRNCRFLQKDDRNQEGLPVLQAALSEGRAAQVVLRNYRKDGRRFLNEIKIVPLSDESGALTSYCGALRDVSAEASLVRRMEAMAYRDGVTGLLTRARFEQLLTDDRAGWACLMLDVDRLREINATYGRRGGDALLQLLGQRLRDLAGEEGLAGRMEGSTFALLWPAHGKLPEATKEADRRLAMLAAFYQMPGYRLYPRVTGGLSLVEPGEEPLAVLERADAALHAAKEEAPGRLRVHDAALAQGTVTRVKTTEFLRDALEEGQLALRFQPKVALPTGRIIGAEALVRWRHPIFGEQSAASFVPIAEQSGLIVPIGRWVLKETAARIRGWLDGGQAVPPIAVNVSRAQLESPGFLSEAHDLLHLNGLQPGAIILEFTESTLSDGGPELAAQLRGLREAGFGLALDDFGTGYSSLRHVRYLPLTEIKVDGEFIQDIDHDPYSRSVVEMVVRLAASLAVPATAEGVERAQQAAVLAELGCTQAQGYYYSEPLLPEHLMERLSRGVSLPDPADRRDFSP